jgi:hypothetical protein
MIGVNVALKLLPYGEGRFRTRSHHQQRPEDIPRAFSPRRPRVVIRTLLVVGCLILLVSLGRALISRLNGAAAPFIPFTQPCRVLGTWVTATPILSARPRCSAASQ